MVADNQLFHNLLVWTCGDDDYIKVSIARKQDNKMNVSLTYMVGQEDVESVMIEDATEHALEIEIERAINEYFYDASEILPEIQTVGANDDITLNDCDYDRPYTWHEFADMPDGYPEFDWIARQVVKNIYAFRDEFLNEFIWAQEEMAV